MSVGTLDTAEGTLKVTPFISSFVPASNGILTKKKIIITKRKKESKIRRPQVTTVGQQLARKGTRRKHIAMIAIAVLLFKYV